MWIGSNEKSRTKQAGNRPRFMMPSVVERLTARDGSMMSTAPQDKSPVGRASPGQSVLIMYDLISQGGGPVLQSDRALQDFELGSGFDFAGINHLRLIRGIR